VFNNFSYTNPLLNPNTTFDESIINGAAVTLLFIDMKAVSVMPALFIFIIPSEEFTVLFFIEINLTSFVYPKNPDETGKLPYPFKSKPFAFDNPVPSFLNAYT